MMSPNERHLSTEGFQEYLNSGVPLEYPVKGEPRLHFLIDPERPAIGLRVPRKPTQPVPLTGLEHLQVRATNSYGKRFLDVLVTDPRLFIDAYPVLLAIADRIQLDRLSLEDALYDTLRILGRLLEREGTLPLERELGLFGELLLLRGLLTLLDHEEAVSAWLGAGGEEHDFALQGIDLEVKTTALERRIHWIESLTQLVPSPERPLWLVSYQVTKAGPNDGSSLPALLSAIRAELGEGPARTTFEARLQQGGWQDRYGPNTSTRWRHRSKPQAYDVNGDFPRITSALLEAAHVNLAQLSGIMYKIDLSHRPPDPAPPLIPETLSYGGNT
ncbi:PD-(D/E)XK motif protein [Microbispora rosea]|uniref:PD-(D/E)XK motif protein n=1 Tax=Microbispora rosea TaxID=58117 RepID=UPI0034309AB4